MAKPNTNIGTAFNTSKTQAADMAAIAAQALQEANETLANSASVSSDAPTFDTSAYLNDMEPAQAAPQAPAQTDALAQVAALIKALGLDMASLVAPSLAPQAQVARQAFAPQAKAARPGLVAEPNERRFPGGNLNPNLKITAIMPNPKNPSGASYYRYARYPLAPCTIGEALAAGITKADILWDARKGFIAFN